MFGCVPGQQNDESLNLSLSLFLSVLSYSHHPVFNVSFLRCQKDVSNSAESHIVLEKSKASAERQGTSENTYSMCQGVRRLSGLNVLTSIAEQLSSVWGAGGKANMKIYQ